MNNTPCELPKLDCELKIKETTELEQSVAFDLKKKKEDERNITELLGRTTEYNNKDS